MGLCDRVMVMHRGAKLRGDAGGSARQPGGARSLSGRLTSMLLELANVVAGYGGGDVLHGVNLEIGKGRSPASSGQTARESRPCYGSERPAQAAPGADHVRGPKLGWSPAAILACGLVQVPQNHSLFPEMTVRENVELGAFMLAMRRSSSGATRRSRRCSRSCVSGAKSRRAASPAASSVWSSSRAA